LQAVIWLAAPKVQQAAAPFATTRPLALMTNLLNGALLILAVSVSLSAFLSWRVKRAPRSTSIRVTAVGGRHRHDRNHPG
jgi:hypothetical protein